MVDQLSGRSAGDRLRSWLVGNRGIVLRQDPAKAQEIYMEARELIVRGWTQKTLPTSKESSSLSRTFPSSSSRCKNASAHVVRRAFGRGRRSRSASEFEHGESRLGQRHAQL
jgi:hypothetical protein